MRKFDSWNAYDIHQKKWDFDTINSLCVNLENLHLFLEFWAHLQGI